MFEQDALAVLENIVVVTVNYRLGALGKSKVVIHVVGTLSSKAAHHLPHGATSLPPGDSERGPSQHLEAIGCRDTSQKSDTLNRLQTVDVFSIVDAHYQHAPDYYTWSATIDGQFLPDSPANLLSSGLTQPVINAEKIYKVEVPTIDGFPSVPGIQQPPEQYDNNQAHTSISTEGVS
ncbi:hypothetical protein ElyMa_006188900 [Elysia marginata]|uniref:Uncharacterized protein n=1 Tax=Elysia marginata TaxID=1093978 RepID=A0AAV4H4J6_9GAST|nr:hypothetical protein ElyMa_006188900 [Elysia marginata]